MSESFLSSNQSLGLQHSRQSYHALSPEQQIPRRRWGKTCHMAPLPPTGHLPGVAAVAEEQQGDRWGLERLSPESQWLHVLYQEMKFPGLGRNGKGGTSKLRNGAEVRDSLAPRRVAANCQKRSKC